MADDNVSGFDHITVSGEDWDQNSQQILNVHFTQIHDGSHFTYYPDSGKYDIVDPPRALVDFVTAIFFHAVVVNIYKIDK